jgi:hypothetical protein
VTTTLLAVLVTAQAIGAFGGLLAALNQQPYRRPFGPRILHISARHELLYHGRLARHFRDWSAWPVPEPGPAVVLEIGRPAIRELAA